MADTIMALMIAAFGILSGVLYIRNSTRRLTEMDIRKRAIRFLKGVTFLAAGFFYIGIVFGGVETPSLVGALVARMLFVIIFALSAAYAYIER